jgi:nitroreductase
MEPGRDRGSQADAAAALIHARHSVAPRHLHAPAPDARQLHDLLLAAAAAPDHGQRVPWRFVEIPADARGDLAEVFAAALLERDAQANEEQLARARNKAHDAPLLLLAIVDSGPEGDAIPPLERVASAGCALQNMLLLATAQGFACAMTSGRTMVSHALRSRFGLSATEQALCFVSIGTGVDPEHQPQRPDVARFSSTLRTTRPGTTN